MKMHSRLGYDLDVDSLGVRPGTMQQSKGISPQSCTETDFEMKTSNLVLFLLISVVSVHFRAIDDETIPCQA